MDIKLAATERRRNYLVSKPNTTKLLTENSFAIEISKTQIICSCKTKTCEKVKLSYMDT